MIKLKPRLIKESNPVAYLRFTDGLIVDGTRCPLGILSHPHWRRVDGLEVAGEPNAACACTEQVA